MSEPNCPDTGQTIRSALVALHNIDPAASIATGSEAETTEEHQSTIHLEIQQQHHFHQQWQLRQQQQFHEQPQLQSSQQLQLQQVLPSDLSGQQRGQPGAYNSLQRGHSPPVVQEQSVVMRNTNNGDTLPPQHEHMDLSTNQIEHVSQNSSSSNASMSQKRPANHSDTEISSKRSASAVPQYLSSIPTQNRFDVLEELDGEQESQSATQTFERIPPVFIYHELNYPIFVNVLKQILKCKFTIEVRRNFVKVQPTSSDDYRDLTKHLDNHNLNYHTYSLPGTKPLSVIIRHVPPSIPEPEILQELKSLNYPVKQVNRIYMSRQPTFLVAVLLDDTDQGRTIMKLKVLFHCVVEVEPRRRRPGPPQCTNCQDYGHTKNNCRRNPNCVRCPGNHHWSQCQLPKQTPPICINCSTRNLDAGHRANSRDCPYFTSLLARKPNRIIPNSYSKPSNSVNPANTQTYSEPSVSFPQHNINKQHEYTQSFPIGVQNQNVHTNQSHPQKTYAQSLKNCPPVSSPNTNLQSLLSPFISQLQASIETLIKELFSQLISSLPHLLK